MMKKYLLGCLFALISLTGQAQQIWGNTGLLHLPTADMQRDKTLMFGWNWLDEQATPNAVPIGWDRKPTMNYFVNVTIFPWLEVSYTCTLMRGEFLAVDHGLDPEKFDKWANQDRHFDVRLRVWKEGWWKSWTPQVVVGMNDAFHTFHLGSNGSFGNASDSINGYWGRTYVAATKHFTLRKVGTLGVHVAYLHNDRPDFHYEGLGGGVNLRFDRVQTGKVWLDRCLRGLNLMAEYDTRTVNVGAQYSVWKERINAYMELTDCKHPSAGVCFKVCLK